MLQRIIAGMLVVSAIVALDTELAGFIGRHLSASVQLLADAVNAK